MKKILYTWTAPALFMIAAAILFSSGWRSFNSPEIVIEWSTGSELSTVGFNLLRSESPDGPWSKVNPSLIPPASDPLIGGDYSYVDQDIRPDVIYYYYLEDIDENGTTTRNGPIEITAQRGGVIEMIAAVLLLVMGIISLVRMRSNRLQTLSDGQGKEHAA